MDAMAASHGAVRAVSDDEILDAYRFLAAHEGVFCEPASARRRRRAAQARRRGRASGSPACSPATGSRTRRPRSRRPAPSCPCEPELAAVERAVLG